MGSLPANIQVREHVVRDTLNVTGDFARELPMLIVAFDHPIMCVDDSWMIA